MNCFFTTFFALLLITSRPPVASAAALEKINASYGAISGSMAQTWVAKEAKLFEKHGLDVNKEGLNLQTNADSKRRQVDAYLLSRSSPQVTGASPEGFIETRYVNELESSGFF